MTKYKKILLVLVFCLLGATTSFNAVKADTELVAPTINKVDKGLNSDWYHPFISGTTASGTEVLIYFDKNFSGKAQTFGADNATNNFYYQPSVALSFGFHEVTVVAQRSNPLGMSTSSAPISFLSANDSSAPVNLISTATLENVAPVISNVVPAPTILSPGKNSVVANNQLVVKGLTFTGTKVLVYVDDVLKVETNILKHESGTAGFTFKPVALGKGWHIVRVIAINSRGEKSSPSSFTNFKVEDPMPSPIVLKKVVNSKTTATKPFIVGLAKNNSHIKMYIDNKFNGEFNVVNRQSGTANFAYLPAQNLAKGNHVAYATAIDSKGKESRLSNKLYFSVLMPAITAKAATEKAVVVPKITATTPKVEVKKPVAAPKAKVKKVETTPRVVAPKTAPKIDVKPVAPAPGATSTAATSTNNQNVTNEDIQKILDDKNNTTTGANNSGVVDENKASQDQSKWNIIIFVLFLVGVIAWILWVNRELIKEKKNKKEDTEEDKDDEEKKDNSNQQKS
jgi:hypothetical protein